MDKLDNIIKKVLQEGDTYEKMAAKGKKAGNLKQGTVRKRLGIPKDEKIPLSKINKEISRLKKMDKDDDKKGVQLGDKNQKYYKALQLSKTLKTTTNMNEEDRATRVDKMLSGEYEDEDYKDSKRYADVRADLEDEMNEEFSSTEQKMINQIKSYKKRGSAMINLPSKVRDFYFKNKEKIDALNENMGEWPKELTSRYSDEYRFELEKVMSDRAKYRVIDIESGELKGTPVFGKPESLMAFADDLIKPQGGTQSSHFGTNENINEDKYFSLEKGDKLKVPHPIYKNLTLTITNPKGSGYEYYSKHDEGGVEKGWAEAGYFSSAIEKGDAELIKAVKEDINDPVLMRTRAAQMKRDAMDKKDLENKSKRISVEKAIDLRYELSILDKEREDILMRIEDIGVEMDQTAEPEGGPIADKLGERLMAAQRELRAIDSKIIDIKDDLGVFDMNEIVNEDEVDEEIETSLTPNEIDSELAGNEYASPAFESLYQSLKEKLNQRLGK